MKLAERIASDIDSGKSYVQILKEIEFAYPHLAADIQARKSRGDYSSDIVEDLLVASPQVSVGEMTPIQSQMNQAIYSQRADKEGYGTQIMRGFRKGALGTLIPGGPSQSEIEMEEAFAPKSSAKSFVEGTAELASDLPLLGATSALAAPTGPIGASAAAMGASQSLKEIRKAFRTYQESGGPKDWGEFVGEVTEAAKNVGVEAAIGGALGTLGPLVKATGLTGKAAKAAAVAGEGAVLTGAHVAKTGELPTPGEALVVIAQIATLKGAHKIAGLLKSDGGRAAVKKAYAELTPEQQQALMSGDINSSRFDQVLNKLKENIDVDPGEVSQKHEKVIEKESSAISKKFQAEREQAESKIESIDKKIKDIKSNIKNLTPSEKKDASREIKKLNKEKKIHESKIRQFSENNEFSEIEKATKKIEDELKREQKVLVQKSVNEIEKTKRGKTDEEIRALFTEKRENIENQIKILEEEQNKLNLSRKELRKKTTTETINKIDKNDRLLKKLNKKLKQYSHENAEKIINKRAKSIKLKEESESSKLFKKASTLEEKKETSLVDEAERISAKFKEKRRQAASDVKLISSQIKSLEEQLKKSPRNKQQILQKELKEQRKLLKEAENNLLRYSQEREQAKLRKVELRSFRKILRERTRRQSKQRQRLKIAEERNVLDYYEGELTGGPIKKSQKRRIIRVPLPEALKQLPIEEIAKMHVEVAAEKESPRLTRLKEMTRNAREKLYRGIFDSAHQLKKLTQATKSDVDLQSMYYDSQRASALTEYRMKHGTFDPSTKESTGDIGLQEAIEKVAPEDYSNETLSLLLASRASIDRQNLGMKNPIPTDVAEAMQRKYTTQYKGVLDEISKLNDEMLSIAKNAGILSEEGIAAMKELHKAYAPLERVFEEGELAVGQGESTTSPGYLKRAGDSLRKIVDPLVTTLKNYDLTVKQAERNRLATAIADEYMKLGYKAVEVPADSSLANTVAKENRALAKNLRETESIYSPEAFTDGKETLYFYKGGKKYKIDNVDPSIAQLLRRPKSALGVLDGPIRWVKSKVSKANFTLSVIGMPVIQAKDMIVNAVSQKSLLGSWQYLASLPQSIFESVKKSSPIWHDYMKSGLYTHDYRALSSQDFASIAMDVFDAKRSQNKSIASRAINTLTAPYRALEYIDRTLSNAQKLTSLKLELKNPEYNGLPKEQRIAKAKAAVEKRTLNFQRSGSFALIRALNSAIPVFNTSIQDVDTIARQIKNNPAFLTNIVANITIPSIMAYMNVRDDERYKRLPQYVKDENIIVRPWFGLWEDQKSDLWLIPKPWLVGYVGTTMPVRFMQYIDSEKGEETLFEVAEELLEKFGEEINPFSFIYGKRSPIPRGMARIAAAEQYTPSTPEIAKAASRALGGYFSPITIDVTAQMLLGGIYKDLAPIVDELVYASEVPAYTQQDLAEFGAKFLKRFHTRGADLRSSYLNKFYDLAAEEDAKLATIKLAEIRGETKKAEELRDKGYYKTANARKAISRIFKQAFEIQNASPKRYSRSKKDQLLRELAQDMDEFAKRYVEAIQESRKFHKETT